MFTGIIRHRGRIRTLEAREAHWRLVVAVHWQEQVAIGDSVAVDGICLTVTHLESGALHFDVVEETMRRTNLRFRQAGDVVNLETALRMGERVEGHWVFGHVDTVVPFLGRREDLFWFGLPDPWQEYVAEKGSVALNGVSLTVARKETDRFAVALIPHTLRETNLGLLREGDPVNLEVDMVARYVVERLRPYLR